MNTLLPIREISRLTGINSITLRAWERRYGLLKPLRTDKGHRLYRQEDIELINKIQQWLACGLAIGKVSELLESGQQETVNNIENTWLVHLQHLLVIIDEFNLNKLESFFNELFAVYPADIIADYLIVPAIDKLQSPLYGNAAKRSVLTHRLSEYLCMFIQRQRHASNGPRIGIIQLSVEGDRLLNILLHYALTMSQYRSEYIGLIESGEIILLQEKLSLDAIVIYNDATTTLYEFQKSLALINKKNTIPIIVAGKLANVIDANAFQNNVYFLNDGGQKVIIDALNLLFPMQSVSQESISAGSLDQTGTL